MAKGKLKEHDEALLAVAYSLDFKEQGQGQRQNLPAEYGRAFDYHLKKRQQLMNSPRLQLDSRLKDTQSNEPCSPAVDGDDFNSEAESNVGSSGGGSGSGGNTSLLHSVASQLCKWLFSFTAPSIESQRKSDPSSHQSEVSGEH